MKNLNTRKWYYLIASGVVLWFAVRASVMTFKNHRLARKGKVTKGILTNLQWKSSSYRNPDGFFYQFTVDSVIYTGHTFDETTGPLDTIEVVYLPSDPGINKPLDFINHYYK